MPESRRDYDRTLLTDAAGVSTLIASLAASRPGSGRERWMLTATATAGVALAALARPRPAAVARALIVLGWSVTSLGATVVAARTSHRGLRWGAFGVLVGGSALSAGYLRAGSS